MSIYTPIVASTADGPDITLCKILDSVAGTNSGYDEIALSDYTGANPGTIEYKKEGTTIRTITLTWSGDNLTNVVWS